MILKMDGRGNIYDAETGRALWTGEPAAVLALLKERAELQAEVDWLRADNVQLTEAGIAMVRKNEALMQECHDLRNQLQIALLEEPAKTNGRQR